MKHFNINWQVSPKIRAFTSKIDGGFSEGGYSSMNLALHVNDQKSAVLKNRQSLVDAMKLPSSPKWLDQRHTTNVVNLDDSREVAKYLFNQGDDVDNSNVSAADGSYTSSAGVVAAVLTADCLPVYIADKDAKVVAVLHAGWRGLVNGIIDQAVSQIKQSDRTLVAALGPAIGPDVFEVGAEVRDAFNEKGFNTQGCFIENPLRADHYFANLYALATQRLNQLGIMDVWHEPQCTYTQQQDYFSYRRAPVCGRMASVIWIAR